MLATLRKQYEPPVPDLLRCLRFLHLEPVGPPRIDNFEIQRLFPSTCGRQLVRGVKGRERISFSKRVGVLFSGGQAPGGHNVIAGLFRGLKQLHPDSRLWGFLGGPAGIMQGAAIEITEKHVHSYFNQGGFDMLGSGRAKIETEDQFETVFTILQKMELDGLVVIGGDDSNTNVALLAEYFASRNGKTAVIGVPKTIDGDLQSEELAISFGFDTACKTYSEIIGNIARDAVSGGKYTHFIKLMGRTASHIALECALKTHPNVTLIGEEIGAGKQTLSQVTSILCDAICARAGQGKNHGVILLPEGLIEFIPEMQLLLQELSQTHQASGLSPASRQLFDALPGSLQKQLLFDRDPHGNVNVSLIETERLLIDTVSRELERRGARERFHPVSHFLGYEGRSGFPSNFDCNYCYALGLGTAALIEAGMTGYMCCIQGLTRPPAEWTLCGLPIARLLHLETRKGKVKPVIQKTLVNLEGPLFRRFAQERKRWLLADDYHYPGPIQFFGDPQITDSFPLTLATKSGL